MMLCSVHGARIVNLALDSITPLAARDQRIASYLKVFFRLLISPSFYWRFEAFTGVFTSTRKRALCLNIYAMVLELYALSTTKSFRLWHILLLCGSNTRF